MTYDSPDDSGYKGPEVEINIDEPHPPDPENTTPPGCDQLEIDFDWDYTGEQSHDLELNSAEIIGQYSFPCPPTPSWVRWAVIRSVSEDANTTDQPIGTREQLIRPGDDTRRDDGWLDLTYDILAYGDTDAVDHDETEQILTAGVEALWDPYTEDDDQ